MIVAAFQVRCRHNRQKVSGFKLDFIKVCELPVSASAFATLPLTLTSTTFVGNHFIIFNITF